MITNDILLPILAIWILLASISCKLSCGNTLFHNVIYLFLELIFLLLFFSYDSNYGYAADQNHPPAPLCVYPPSTSLPPPTRTTTLPPSPPYSKPENGVWCVAKPTVTSSVMQEALDYACATGADCMPIQPGGACYQPATLLAHAAYAFNSYWQRNKKGGGTCDFGGAAMLATVDPSKYFIFISFHQLKLITKSILAN